MRFWEVELDWKGTQLADYPKLAPENITPDLTEKRVERKFICWNFGTLEAFIFSVQMFLHNYYTSLFSRVLFFKGQQQALSQQAFTPDASEFLNVEHWKSCRLYHSNGFWERSSTAVPLPPPNTDSAHFLSDTAALSGAQLHFQSGNSSFSLLLLFSPGLSLPSTAKYSAVFPLKWQSCTNWGETENHTPLTCHFWKHGLLLLTSLLWAFVSCTVWYCFSRCHSFSLTEMYKLIFHVLGSFFLLGVFLYLPLTGFCWLYIYLVNKKRDTLPFLHCPIPSCSRLSKVCSAVGCFPLCQEGNNFFFFPYSL